MPLPPLTKPAVRYDALEETALDLMNEWLAGFFDGAAHAVGDAVPVAFPNAVLRFQQSEQPQPQDGLGITVVMLSPQETRRRWETIAGERQEMGEHPVTFQFWVRASGKMPDAADPAWHARRASQLLYATLVNSHAHHPLVQKGVARLRVRPAETIIEKSHATRLVTCRATLRAVIPSQVEAGGEGN